MVVKIIKSFNNEMTGLSRSVNWAGDQNIVGYQADKSKIIPDN